MMERYPHEALFEMGFADDAWDRLRKRHGYAMGTTHTLGEKWGPANHGYAGGSLATLSGTVAGIRPLTPGYATYQVCPTLGSLSAVRCVVPSPKGDIEVEQSAADKRFRISLASPKWTVATLGIPRGPQHILAIKLGDAQVWQGQPAAHLPAGVTFAGDQDGWIRFSVPPGRWVVGADAERAP